MASLLVVVARFLSVRSHRKNRFLACGFLGFGVVLLRVPFLQPGYGPDPDGWRLVEVSRYMAEGGAYVASRLPGYPVYEAIVAVLPVIEPLTVNGLTALATGVAAILFGVATRDAGCREWILAGTALSLVPGIAGASTVAMDYLFSLVYILATYVLLHRGHAVSGGITLGLAIGTRLSSVLFALPAAFIAYGQGRYKPAGFRNVALFSIVTTVIAGGMYFKSIQIYGPGLLHNYPYCCPISWPAISLRAISLFGGLGTLALIASGLVILGNRFGLLQHSRSVSLRSTRYDRLVWVLTIELFTLLFLRFPYESEYLIPIIPFVLFLAGALLSRRVFGILLVLVSMGAFVDLDLQNRELLAKSGLLRQSEERQTSFLRRQDLINHVNAAPNPVIVLAGTQYPKLMNELAQGDRGDIPLNLRAETRQLRDRLLAGAIPHRRIDQLWRDSLLPRWNAIFRRDSVYYLYDADRTLPDRRLILGLCGVLEEIDVIADSETAPIEVEDLCSESYGGGGMEPFDDTISRSIRLPIAVTLH